MRLRCQRRIRKRLRRMRGYEQILAARVLKSERHGLPLVEALRLVVLDATGDIPCGRRSASCSLERIKLFRLC